MTREEEMAYEWALKQSFPSVAARYARRLAEYIRRVRDAEQRHEAEAGGACPKCGASGFDMVCDVCSYPIYE